MPPFERLAALLRRGDAYTKTDLVYLTKNGAWLAGGQIGIALSALLISIAFAHFVPKDVYGTYRFLVSLFWILTAFSLTGLPPAIAQAVARGFEGVYKKSFRLSLLGSIPMTILAGSMGVYYLLNQNSVLGVGMFIIGALAPFIQPAFLYGNYLEGKKDFRRLAIFGILLNATQAVLLIGTMYVTKDPLLFLASYLGGNIVAGIVFYFYVRSIYKPNELVNADFNSLAMHFSAMNILSTVSQQIDKLLVFHYLGAAQLALYSFAIALPEQAKTAINSVSTIAFPKFAERPLKEIMPNFWHRMRWFSGALVLAALGYILLAPYLFQLFFPTYGDAVIYSQVFAISIIFLSNTIPPTLLQAHAANKELYLFNVVTPLFQILALCILIPQFGLFGIIAARIVGRAFNLVLGAYLVRHYALTEQG